MPELSIPSQIDTLYQQNYKNIKAWNAEQIALGMASSPSRESADVNAKNRVGSGIPDDVIEHAAQQMHLIFGDSHCESVAKLAAIETVAKDKGIDLSPLSNDIDVFVKEHTGKDYEFRNGFHELSLITDPQIQKIPLENRWKICGIDPVVLRYLIRSPSEVRGCGFKPPPRKRSSVV